MTREETDRATRGSSARVRLLLQDTDLAAIAAIVPLSVCAHNASSGPTEAAEIYVKLDNHRPDPTCPGWPIIGCRNVAKKFRNHRSATVPSNSSELALLLLIIGHSCSTPLYSCQTSQEKQLKMVKSRAGRGMLLTSNLPQLQNLIKVSRPSCRASCLTQQVSPLVNGAGSRYTLSIACLNQCTDQTARSQRIQGRIPLPAQPLPLPPPPQLGRYRRIHVGARISEQQRKGQVERAVCRSDHLHLPGRAMLSRRDQGGARAAAGSVVGPEWIHHGSRRFAQDGSQELGHVEEQRSH